MSVQSALVCARQPYMMPLVVPGSAAKKSLRHPKADETKRATFIQQIEAYEHDKRNIVYVDESGFAKDMPRLHGYSRRGERCYGTHNWHERGRVNAIGAILAGVFLTCSLVSCNVDSEVFHAWVCQDLLPKLPEKSVIVMDNATFHKRQDTKDAIERDGHTLEFLPPYSPDLNPIEPKWAQAKARRRKTGETPEKIFKTIF